ncbi:MAG: pyruvate ferredoxin oxidoreductase, partial [Gammaproteobacteria bacterium]|nr:pyruvate ferredoxin oxidoreductase [Gammaproteobacteria bacterium]
LSSMNANRLAERLMGDTIYANIIMTGCAWQKGMIPVSLEALQRAIELNGVKTDANKQAFMWGRIAAHDPAAIEKLLGANEAARIESLEDMIEARREFLVGYQNAALAERYVTLVEKVRTAEASIGDGDSLSRAVTQAWFRLLSYKDEYEVARLQTSPEFLASVHRDFGDNAKLRFHLAPPLLGGKKDARGRPLKREFGAWILPVFRLLARLKGLRGTAFDVFGYTAERRMERELITEFESLLNGALPDLDTANYADLLARVSAYLDVRGFGPVKEQAVQEMRATG